MCGACVVYILCGVYMVCILCGVGAVIGVCRWGVRGVCVVCATCAVCVSVCMWKWESQVYLTCLRANAWRWRIPRDAATVSGCRG